MVDSDRCTRCWDTGMTDYQRGTICGCAEGRRLRRIDMAGVLFVILVGVIGVIGGILLTRH